MIEPRQKKILIVDDERSVTDSLNLILTDAGFHVLTAHLVWPRTATPLLEQGVLRKDLYFRISTIKIRVPPLRERLDDIPLLARHFLERFNLQYGIQRADPSLPASNVLSQAQKVWHQSRALAHTKPTEGRGSPFCCFCHPSYYC